MSVVRKLKETIVGILYNRKILAIACLLTIPGFAQANAGVPMIFLVMPAFAVAIIPIFIIEAVYLSICLTISGKLAAKTATISNLASTLAGIPLTWLILVVIQMLTGGGSAYGIDTPLTKFLAVTWQAPWLILYESDLHWMIPVAGLVLLLPFFFVSWGSEYYVTKKLVDNIETITLKKAVRNANLITYGLLTLWPLTMLIMANE